VRGGKKGLVKKKKTEGLSWTERGKKGKRVCGKIRSFELGTITKGQGEEEGAFLKGETEVMIKGLLNRDTGGN